MYIFNQNFKTFSNAHYKSIYFLFSRNVKNSYYIRSLIDIKIKISCFWILLKQIQNVHKLSSSFFIFIENTQNYWIDRNSHSDRYYISICSSLSSLYLTSKLLIIYSYIEYRLFEMSPFRNIEHICYLWGIITLRHLEKCVSS